MSDRPRTDYEMTEEDLSKLMAACKPVAMIALQCGTPASPQENANNAWKELGEKMGFDHTTVVPVHGGRRGKGDKFFSAVSTKEKEQ